MSSRIHDHVRSNVVGYVALFIALSGVAYAGGLKANKVKTKHIQDAAVTTPKLADGAVTSPKVANDALKGEDIDESSLQGVGGSGAPSGPAGGDLTGSYPNPGIAPGAVNSNAVADNSLTGNDVNESQLDSSVVQTRVGSSCSPGEAIRAIAANGTVTCETDDAGGGGPPTGSAGGDLTGTYPDPEIDADAVGGPEVALNALGGNDIDESTLTGVNASLLDGFDTATMLTPNRIYVSTAAGVLPFDTVNSSSVAANTLEANDIAGGAIVGGPGGDVQDNSLTADDLAPNSVSVSELANDAVVGGLGGDVQDNTLNAEDLAPTSVTSSELADNAVVGGNLGDVQDNTLTRDDIANDGVGGAEVLNASDANGLKRGDVGLVQTPTTTVQSVPANSCFEFGTSVSGADLASPVILGPPSGLNAGVTATGFVSSPGQVTLRVCNVTTAAITLNSGTWSVVVLEP